MASNSFYTPEEDEIIRLHYPTATHAEIAQMLPDRTPTGIRVRANRLGVRKNKECWEVGFPLDGSLIGHLTEAEKGYLAGIIDGEGCIRLARRLGKRGQHIYLIQVVIANTSPKLHEWLESKIPGSGYVNKKTHYTDPRPSSHPAQWKPSYRWIVSGSRFAIVFLKEIAPYLIIKREQAELLINGYVHLSESERDELFRKLHDLKKSS
jgi:hypothetical protein